MSKITKFSTLVILYSIFAFSPVFCSESSKAFNEWVISFKSSAKDNGVSNETLELAFKNVKFLEQVIRYDRKQPEFFEDTITYISKRANKSRSKKAKNLLKVNQKLFKKSKTKRMLLSPFTF